MTNAPQNLSMTPEEIAGSLAVVQEVFRTMRPLILSRAGNVAFTDKQDGSPVTDTDVEVEKALQDELARRYPGMRVFGEEGGYEDNLTGAFWLVDPIDGTSSFVKNVPTFTSMAVLIQGGEAVASVIYNPSTDDMFVAQKGKGTFRNGVQIKLGEMPLSPVAYCKARFFEPLNKILAPMGVECKNGPEGGGFGFTLVVDGSSAARFNLLSRGYTHDYAPGGLLVREAGGVLIPVQEDEYTYETRSFIACHPDLAELMQKHAHEIGAIENELRD
ncbi:MAG TPA: inositol monophosphatase [Candidatus Saccharimonadales bacterium]|nr:inositol monophosphatase [Candidatus Saccharimonadales bacterium]